MLLENRGLCSFKSLSSRRWCSTFTDLLFKLRLISWGFHVKWVLGVTVLPLMIVQYWTHSVETPIIVDPQWIYSIDDPREFSSLLRWGWAFVYFWITYVRFIPIMLTVLPCPSPPVPTLIFLLFMWQVSFEWHQDSICWTNVELSSVMSHTFTWKQFPCDQVRLYAMNLKVMCVKSLPHLPRSQWVYIWMPVQNGR